MSSMNQCEGRPALITGVGGQVGSYLAEFLISMGYEVHGLVPQRAMPNLRNIRHLLTLDRFQLHQGDITDVSSIQRALKLAKPVEVYNLAAQSVHPDTLLPVMLSGQSLKVRRIRELWDQVTKKHPVKLVSGNSEGGPVEVEVVELSKSSQLRALGYWCGMGTWFRIKQVSRHRYQGKLCVLTQKWGRVAVTPNHSVYAGNGQLVRPTENPELLPMRKMNYFPHTSKQKVTLRVYGREQVRDGWICGSRENAGRVRQVLRAADGSLQDFLAFAGAFIAEGNLNYNRKNGSYTVTISNQDRRWLKSLQRRLESFFSGKSWITRNNKDNYRPVYNLQMSSKLLWKLMGSLCGDGFTTKRLPNFFFSIDQKFWNHLLDAMVFGDGWETVRQNGPLLGYVTTSEQLAAELGLLLTMQGRDYSVEFIDPIEGHLPAFRIREVRSHQPHQGQRRYEEVDFDGYVYDIAVEEVENFCVGVGNIVVHNSFVGSSWQLAKHTAEITGMGALNVLEACRQECPQARVFQASSSEMFGSSGAPQNEQTRFQPSSPYAAAKVFAHHMAVNYRDSYDMFICCGITFNCESERRPIHFVTQKIATGAARIAAGLQNQLKLGNLEAKRDWGFAGDYVEAFWKIMNHYKPGDYVIGTGETYSVQDFVEACFAEFSLDWREHVVIDESLLRPKDVPELRADASHIDTEVGWYPQTRFEGLVRIMTRAAERQIQEGLPSD